MRTGGIPVLVLAAGLGVLPVPAAPQTNVEVLSQLNPAGGPSGVSYMDIWGYTAPDGTELAILCAVDATIFVDVTQPTRPQVVLHAFGEPTTHRDARTHGTYAYVVNETSGGLDIFDLSDPRRPQLALQWNETFDSAHNIGIYDGFAYIAGSKKNEQDSGMRILDLKDPLNPVDAGAYTTRYVHDVFVRDNIGYLSTIRAGRVTVVDLLDKSSPTEIASIPSGAGTHNAWLTENGEYLLTTHEVQDGKIRFWDVRDLQDPVSVGSWIAAPGATVHNVFVRGDSAYISHYAEGLRVLDITDPTSPRQVAFLDTRPGTTSGLEGVWGVYPFAASGNVYFSDMQLGLFVVRITDTDPIVDGFRLQAPAPQTAEPGQPGPMLFSFPIANLTGSDETYSLEFINSMLWAMDSPRTLFVPAQGVNVATLVVHAPGSVHEPTEVNVSMCATAKSTRERLCVASSEAVPVVLQAFEATYDASRGALLQWSVWREPGDTGVLAVLRSREVEPRAWETRARLSLDAQRFIDAEVTPGAWVYALLLENAGGATLLAERALQVAGAPFVRALGNVPNPFNPTTSIRFELASPMSVDVHIFDLRGRLVRRLHTVAGVGSHAVLWDGRDARGRPQSSGAYLYEVHAGGRVARSRMTLLR